MDIVNLPKKTKLYKTVSNKYSRQSVFAYKINDTERCSNMSWFAMTRSKALYYKDDTSSVYDYTINKKIKLISIDSYKNLKKFIKKVENVKNVDTLSVLYRGVTITETIKKHFLHYSYINMDIKERAIYEYMFAFGFLTVNEQLKFVKLVLKLQEYGLIENIKKMKDNILINNSFIQRLSRLFFKIIKYDIPLNEVGHRYSLYQIDINVISNLCLFFHDKYDGYILDTNKNSYWHKNMNDLNEILLFNVKNIII